MLSVLVLAAALAALAGATGVFIGNPQPSHGPTLPILTETIDLDVPADLRWVSLAGKYRESITYVINEVKAGFPPNLMAYLEALLTDIDSYLGKEYRMELEGVAAGAQAVLGDIVLMNLYYEFTAACTSIVAQSSNGTIYHGRNLDYGITGLQNTTVLVQFQSNGNTLYQGVTFCGYVGLLTGEKKNAFSLSVDERDNGTLWENFFEALFEHGKPIGFTIRDALANEPNYAAALSILQTQHLIASVYIIIGGAGPNEGAVITRERQSTYNLWPLDYPSQWFLVITNYDHNLPPPPNDNRSGPAIAMMEKSSPATVTLDYIYNVLSTFPMLNSETMYTAMMSSTLDTLWAYTRNN